MESGFFQLKNPTDLFRKLEWEYGNVQAHPGDPRHAFNFFVTAEHMVDWMKKSGIEILRDDFPILKIVSHIANGGKHFVADKTRNGELIHTSVKSAVHDGVFEPGVFEEGVYEESLQITLEADAAAELNRQTIDAVSLASEVLEFWRKRI